ncbi:MAG: DNA-binding protein [Bacteroidetes bacterium]|nr:DNA-binding protein [Bacteroidota bacterium]
MVKLSFETLPQAVADLTEQVSELKRLIIEKETSIAEPQKGLLSDYVSKTEVRGKLASSSTLWHWEKAGKLQSYGIGGKRYYKRADIENLFTPIK